MRKSAELPDRFDGRLRINAEVQGHLVRRSDVGEVVCAFEEYFIKPHRGIFRGEGDVSAGTFICNRMKLRFKDKSGNIQLAHTLNGSALALPRIVAALLENNQTENGIRIPKALVAYTGFEFID